MKEFTIYYHKSPENKYYIGQTCQELERRWKSGKGYTSTKFSLAIEKFGWDNFEHGVLEEHIPQEKIDEVEAYYIELFDAVDNGYNTYKQNYSGYHFSDLWSNNDIKQSMVKKLIEQRNTQEYHEAQSQRMKKLWETEKYRKSQKESWTKERKEKMSKKVKEYWKDPEYKNKIQKAQSEYRKKDWQNPEYRKKMCVQVRCVETNEIFESVKAASEWCGVKSNTLSMALRSKTHQSGKHPESGVKLHWVYANEVGEEGSGCHEK